MTDNKEFEVQTVTSNGSPVKERITSILSARARYNKLVQDANPEAIRRARLKGMIDGNPPRSPTRLRELGMGNAINVNFLEARAILDMKAASYYELFFEVPTLIETKLRYKLSLPSEQQMMANQWAQIVSEEFTRTMFDWPGFLINMDKARREADAYGVGVMFWGDETDWRPKAYSRGSFYPDPMAELDVDNLGDFCLRSKMTAHELWKAIEDEDSATKIGWNVSAVRRVLVKTFLKEGQNATGDVYQTSDWESIQQRLRNNDWSIQDKAFDTVKIVHQCIKETDTGEVSHYIFPEDADAGRDDFLFSKPRRFKKMSQVLWWLPYNSGDHYLRSCRGLASMIEPHCDLSNRYLCQLFEAGFLTGSLIVQPQTELDLSRMQLIRMGAVTILPARLEAIQTSFTPRLSELVELRDLSSAIMKNNTGVFKQHSEVFAERGPQKTARQVVEEVAKENRVEKAGIAFDYVQLDHLYREIFRKIVNPDLISAEGEYPGQKEARDFVMRCITRGVPQDLITNSVMWDISATRAIGMGSWSVKMDITGQVLGMRSLLDEEGQTNAVRDRLAVLVGYGNVDRYKPMRNRNEVPSNEHGIATLENNDMIEGSQVPVGNDQVHGIHEIIHRGLIIEILKGAAQVPVEQIPDVPKLIAMLSVLLPHYAQTLQFMGADPERKPLVDAGVELFKQGMTLLKKLQQAYQQLLAQQQQQIEANQATVDEARQTIADREFELKAQKQQGDLQIKARGQESLNKMREDKTQEQMSIRREQMAEDMRLKAERQSRELEMDAIVTNAKVELEKIKAAAKNAGV